METECYHGNKVILCELRGLDYRYNMDTLLWGSRVTMAWGQWVTMRTEGNHRDEGGGGGLPWIQSVTMGTEGYYGNSGLPWGQQVTKGIVGYLGDGIRWGL